MTYRIQLTNKETGETRELYVQADGVFDALDQAAEELGLQQSALHIFNSAIPID